MRRYTYLYNAANRSLYDAPDRMSERITLSAIVIGSLFAIALVLYVVDVMPLRALIPAP